MPPPTRSTVKISRSKSVRVSKRKLFSLVATAALASTLGIAMGSTLRFQVLAVSPAPLFNPQQNFPPLAEWPPQVPLEKERNAFDIDQENSMSPPQLVYTNTPDTDVENYNVSEDIYSDEEFPAEKAVILDDASSPIPATFNGKDDVQDITNEVFEEESLPPVVSTNRGELTPEPSFIDEPPANYTIPLTETPSWFNKKPASESQFEDGPIIIAPEEPIQSSDLLSD